jgi:hypothetical protein
MDDRYEGIMSTYQERRTVVAQLGVSPSPAVALVLLLLAMITSSIAVLLFINTVAGSFQPRAKPLFAG